jgi:hypothetical protein
MTKQINPEILERWLDDNYPMLAKTLAAFPGDLAYMLKRAMLRFGEYCARAGQAL